MTARIEPVEAPFEPEVQDELRRMMPRDAPMDPLGLFRTFARHLPMARAMRELGSFLLGGEGRTLRSRDREIVISRVCARCGCEYEWGVHAAAFGGRVGLTPEQLEATVMGGADDPAWSAQDALLIRLVDELHDSARVSDELWDALSAHWTEQQRLELLLLSGWYHAISYLANGTRVAAEPWAAAFPAKP